MEAGEGLPVFGVEAKTIKYYYSKRNEMVPPISLTSSSLGRQMLSIADSSHVFSCNERYEPGSFYEIDHEKLPPKSPIQLKAIRVVMVREATTLDVTVNFPSTLALRSYFSGASQTKECFPELDEKFVMSLNQAGRILRWNIPPAHVQAEKNSKQFWLMPGSSSTAADPMLVELDRKDGGNGASKPVISMGSCLLALKCADVVGWGAKRKVKYIGRHCTATADEKIDERGGSGKKRVRNRMTEDDEKKKQKRKGKKKKKKKIDHGSKVNSNKAAMEGRCTIRSSKDRWSSERYEAAERRLLEIMREKKAELGKPVLRQALREEARKYIGDTGLLDHLLKHMAGKVVSGGTERFRRRHNSDGAMEYWLEPADLMEVRRKAGIIDSFWVPPPGWKLGDAIFPSSCGADCMRAIAELKHQLATQFIRYDEQQILLKKLEKEAKEMRVDSDKVISEWQEKCRILVEQKTKQEAELSALFGCIRGLKEEVQQLKDDQMKLKGEESIVTHISSGKEAVTCRGGKMMNRAAAAAARRSGFRICKPQGTFLWPSCSGQLQQQQQQQLQMIFPVCGPPSASSSTASTAPKLQFLPAPGSDSEVMAVPQLLLHRPGTSQHNPCVSQYTPNPYASVSVQCTGAREGEMDDALRAPAVSSPWKVLRWGGLATDLALATPSPYH